MTYSHKNSKEYNGNILLEFLKTNKQIIEEIVKSLAMV